MTSKERDQLFQLGLEAGKKRRYSEASEIFAKLVLEDDDESLFYLGRCWHGMGHYAKAVSTFRSYIARTKSTAEVEFFLGRSLLALSQPQKALQSFSSAYDQGYRKAQLYGLYGLACLQCRKSQKAVMVLQEAVETFPNVKKLYTAYLNALLVRAVSLFYQGEAELSFQMLTFLGNNGVDTPVLHRYAASCARVLELPKEVLFHLEWLEKEGLSDTVLIYQKAEALFALGDGLKAAQLLGQSERTEAATAISPAQIEKLLPWELMRAGQYKKAALAGLAELKRSPQNADLHLLIGEAWRSSGQWERAENHLTLAKTKLKGRKEPSYSLMLLFWQTNENIKAFQESRHLLRLDPNDQEILYYYLLLRTKSNEDTRENISLLQKHIPEYEPDPSLFAALAGEYMKQDLEELAESWLQRALKLDSSHQAAMHLLGKCLEKTTLEPWIGLYEAYLEQRPDEKAIRKDFIHHLLKSKEFSKARDQLLIWISQGERTLSSVKALALASRMTGHVREAYILYRDLVQANSGDEEALTGAALCLAKLGRGHQACELIRRILSSSAKTAQAAYKLGNIALACKENDLAYACYTKAVERDQGHWASLLQLSKLFLQQGDRSKAESYQRQSEKMRLLREKPGR